MVKLARASLLLTMLLIAAGMLACGETSSTPSIIIHPSPTLLKINDPLPLSTGVTVPTTPVVDWTFYENRALGISLYYSPGWHITTETTTNLRLNSPDDHSSIVIADNGPAGNEDLLTWHSRSMNKLNGAHPDVQILQEADTIVAGQPARLSTLIYNYPPGSSGKIAENVISILANQRIYIIEMGSSQSDFPTTSLTIFTPMLQRLHFTRPG